MMHPQPKQTFASHILELRNRSFFVCISLAIGSIIGYQLYNTLIKILLAPLHQDVYYTSPVGGFNFVLQISLLFGVLFSIPVFVYQIFRFLAPIFPPSLERKLFIFSFASFTLMIVGVCFAYFVGLPTALRFLSGFTTSEIHSLISANDYFTFATRYLIGFGLLFQLPLLLLIINYVKPLQPKKLLAYQRHSILAAFILGLILSPAADPLNMSIMAFPLILLFYVSVLFIFIVNKHRPSKEKVSAAGFVQEMEKPATVTANISYFLIIVLISALFGEALLFSYATYRNLHEKHIPVQSLIDNVTKEFVHGK